jgi:hypothetical protein
MNPQELAALNRAAEVLRKHGIPLPTNHPHRCQHPGHTHEAIEPAPRLAGRNHGGARS